MINIEDKYLAEILDILKKYKQVEKAILFGSRSTGTNKSNSDIDIALSCIDNDLSTLLNVKSELENETSIPYMFDLVNLGKVEDELLLSEINNNGTILYKRNEA